MASAANKVSEKAPEQALVQSSPLDSPMKLLEDREDSLALAELAAVYKFEPVLFEQSTFHGIRELQSSLSEF